LVLTIIALGCVSAAVNSSCSRGEHGRISVQKSSTPVTAATLNSPIKSIDFANFSYQWVTGLGKEKESYTLREGKYEGNAESVPMQLFSVIYADVTNDRQEDAIVAVDVVIRGGSASPNVIYVYSMQSGELKLLWAFGTGDRAQGGLRQVIGEDGLLVVELYGKDKVVGTDLFADDGTDVIKPSPFYYTRTRYKWTGKDFKQIEKSKLLSDPKNFRIPIMPRARIQATTIRNPGSSMKSIRQSSALVSPTPFRVVC
jgi:hypothetical protein